MIDVRKRDGRLVPAAEQPADLEEIVPADHLVRDVAAVLDLSWVPSSRRTIPLAARLASIDPALMIRMLIIGYVFATGSGDGARAVTPKLLKASLLSGRSCRDLSGGARCLDQPMTRRSI